MRLRISISDEIFEEAERLARWTRRSRGELYSAALAEYLARHSQDAMTQAMNRVIEEVGQSVDGFTLAASRQILARTEGS